MGLKITKGQLRTKDLNQSSSKSSQSSRIGVDTCIFTRMLPRINTAINLTEHLLRRSFHSLTNLQKTQVKERLHELERHGFILNKTSKQLERINSKKRRQLKKLQKTAYPKDQAFHILRKFHKINNEALADTKLGPTSQSDLKFLSLTKDKRLFYTILGVNGEQLRDSKLIANDVQKFLKRGQLEKAVFLARLAKKKGVVGMNLIMKYYFEVVQSQQSAVDIFNWRKKWGVPIDQHSITILFNGLSKQENLVSKKYGELVLKTIDSLCDKNELTEIEYNTALAALINCTDETLVFKLLNKKCPGLKKDSITYTLMIRSCTRIADEKRFMVVLNDLMNKIPDYCVDSKLLFEYCEVICSQKSPKIEKQGMGLWALCEYFQFDKTIFKKYLTQSDFPTLVPLSHWNINKPFPLNKHVVGLFMNYCLKNKEYDLAMEIFKTLEAQNNQMLDQSIYHKYMETVITTRPITCGDECLDIYERVASSAQISITRRMLILVYNAFQRQSLKAVINKDASNAEATFHKIRGFIDSVEATYSSKLNGKVYRFNSWKFLFPIVKNLNMNDKVSTVELKSILDEYLKSLLNGELGKEFKASIEDKRFVTLEGIRLVKVLTERIKLPSLDSEEIASLKGTERKKFLARRHLLRLKQILLEDLADIEGNSRRKGDSENTSTSEERIMEDLAELILETSYDKF
ncbi:BBT_HP_G0127720.mRNA.1.CDS.1 [Saccharomyces cerevisiae]|nr:BBT_HP_G0102160.mRNA.1.CDS.1 [Saccharomyces cerevisiae]CAI5046820.1 BBT_HP_G0115590.mRNA.1.CDS.1 [Saccharomyces cerevisiae]CAI5092921.1 BBT_HP_G0127720.mRNA.1.CDS.1 [Saccharomyces cerevisiae]CAI6941329.1 BBT_HP_G0102160.mRNA.1.CDS.1 [Saccharomyces cerevisiae]CAI6955954.1 BBT_HP_G0115590.mRNA.1.CDS.1 [Saccharomyces cerevisiae]